MLGDLMGMNSLKARLIVDAAHLAWSNGDLAGLLACYCDDVRYTCNTGPNPSEPFVAVGKQAMMDFLLPVLDIATSMSVVERFVFRNDVATATVACFLTHQATGHVLSGKYRQVITFREGSIAQIDEFHDAARIAAFWKLVNAEANVKEDTDDEPAGKPSPS
jgi:ketosteroid isomerase-like protein